MFFWRRVAPQIPEEGFQQTATPGYLRNFRDLNDQVSRGKSFSGYERNALFLNRGGAGFTDIGGLMGVDYDDDARAIATVDWDRDGDLDMWVANRSAPQLRLLKNNHGASNQSVAVRLIGNGQTTNRDAIGARLRLSDGADSGAAQLRSVRAGDGFLSQSSHWVHFGLGPDAAKELTLTVSWPGGSAESQYALEAGERYLISQEQGILPAPESSPTTLVSNTTEAENAKSDPERSGFWVVNRVPFPELTYSMPGGGEATTTELIGKPVLINLWATWCAPCLQELGELGTHASQLEALGASVLALNVDGLSVDGGTTTKSRPERLLERVGYQLPYGLARQENLAKIEVLIEHLTARRSTLSIPTSILLDREGKAAAVYLERVEWEELAADIALLDAAEETTLVRASPRPGQWLANPRGVDQAAFLGDYANLFGKNGFPGEAQRLYQLNQPREGIARAKDLYNQAKSAAQQGSIQEAIALYQQSLQLDPEYGRALTGLGAIFLQQKRIDEAQSLFEKAIAVDPNHATANINLALIEQMKGDLDNAVARLRKIVAVNPGYFEAHLSLGSALASNRQLDEAIESLSTAVELNPKSVVGYLNLAKALAANQEWERSEAAYRQVMNLDSRMPYPHYGVGNIQSAQQNHAAAIESYGRAITLGARNAATYTRLALSLIATGDKTKALEAVQQALQLDPQHPGANQTLRTLQSGEE